MIKVVYTTSDLEAVLEGFSSIKAIDEVEWDYTGVEGVSSDKSQSSESLSTEEVIEKLERDDFYRAAITEDEEDYQKIVLNYANPKTIMEIEPLDERLERFDGYFQ